LKASSFSLAILLTVIFGEALWCLLIMVALSDDDNPTFYLQVISSFFDLTALIFVLALIFLILFWRDKSKAQRNIRSSNQKGSRYRMKTESVSLRGKYASSIQAIGVTSRFLSFMYCLRKSKRKNEKTAIMNSAVKKMPESPVLAKLMPITKMRLEELCAMNPN
jgi:preprotein translocase subunit SecY